jgi:hypothetical protein
MLYCILYCRSKKKKNIIEKKIKIKRIVKIFEKIKKIKQKLSLCNGVVTRMSSFLNEIREK